MNVGSCCSRFDFKGLIDYIFYSKNTMVPLGLLGPIDAEWFRENKILGCPHRDIPSGLHSIFHSFNVN
jgi:mRNA deadenylase 3'-5' endonuclease subunit Ccr4